MTNKSLQDKIDSYDGTVADMLRNSPTGAYALPLPAEYSNWRDEQRAWRNTAVLFDQSFHMTDIYFKGPDVKRLLTDLGINSFKTFGADKAKQFVACTEEGRVVGDAILFGWSDDQVSIVGRPAAGDWVAFHAETGGYDVEVTRDERTNSRAHDRLTFRYQLQGPDALKIVERAHGGPIDRIKFFNIGEFTIAGCPIRALNHTMSGAPGEEMTGLEMTGPSKYADDVMDAFLKAGAGFDLHQGGARSYVTTSIESGWIASPLPAIYSGDSTRSYREWLPAAGWEATASLGGSYVADDIAEYYHTPWDLGYGHLVRFDHDFLGRSALEQLAVQPHRQKVWLRWNTDDVMDLMRRSVFVDGTPPKYLEAPFSSYCTFPFDSVLQNDQLVGVSAYAGYTVNINDWSSLAMIDEAAAIDGAEVEVIWGEPGGGTAKPTVERHVQTPVRATISTRPLVS